MANIIDILRKYIRPYYYYIITAVITVLFLIVGLYWYKYQKTQTQNRFKDVSNQNRRNHDAPVYFFHADWCPHCKRAQPEWDAFRNQYDGVEINGYIIKCIDVDCTADPPSSEAKAFMNTFNVSSFPTVKMVRDEKTIDFDSKITRTSLGSFVNTMLN
jgi:thiol-disulfide isomerase/thioredoxin